MNDLSTWNGWSSSLRTLKFKFIKQLLTMRSVYCLVAEKKNPTKCTSASQTSLHNPRPYL